MGGRMETKTRECNRTETTVRENSLERENATQFSREKIGTEYQHFIGKNVPPLSYASKLCFAQIRNKRYYSPKNTIVVTNYGRLPRRMKRMERRHVGQVMLTIDLATT